MINGKGSSDELEWLEQLAPLTFSKSWAGGNDNGYYFLSWGAYEWNRVRGGHRAGN